jgi:hypothetical protein
MSTTTSRLQLLLSAHILKMFAQDFFGGGTSNPFAVVNEGVDNSSNKPVLVGQTEVYVSIAFCCCCCCCCRYTVFIFRYSCAFLVGPNTIATYHRTMHSVFNNFDPSLSRVVFIDGYKSGTPLYFDVGVFDFDASQTGKTEQELFCMDAFSQAVITSSSASRELMLKRKFPH